MKDRPRPPQYTVYLDAPAASDFERLHAESRIAKAELLREAVADLLQKYRAKGFLRAPAAESIDVNDIRRRMVEEIKRAVGINIPAMVEAGELRPAGRGWYVARDDQALTKVSPLVTAMESRVAKGRAEVRCKLATQSRWHKLARELGVPIPSEPT